MLIGVEELPTCEHPETRTDWSPPPVAQRQRRPFYPFHPHCLFRPIKFCVSHRGWVTCPSWCSSVVIGLQTSCSRSRMFLRGCNHTNNVHQISAKGADAFRGWALGGGGGERADSALRSARARSCEATLMKCSGGQTTFCSPGAEGSSRNSSVYVLSLLPAIMYQLSTGGTDAGSAQVAGGARGRPALNFSARPCKL